MWVKEVHKLVHNLLNSKEIAHYELQLQLYVCVCTVSTCVVWVGKEKA